MAKASGNPQEMRSFSKHLRDFAQQNENLARQLQRSFDRIDWKDQERQRFESELNDYLRGVKRAAANAPALAAKLDRKAQQLEQYLGG